MPDHKREYPPMQDILSGGTVNYLIDVPFNSVGKGNRFRRR